MQKYRTMLYEGEKKDEQFGWELGNILLFESREYDDAAAAMQEFNQLLLPDKPWFAYMRVTENGRIIDEEMFDSSVIDMEE